MERPTSSVADLQNYRYKPRDPPPPRDLSARDSIRSVPSRDFAREPPPPRYDSRDASMTSHDPLKDKQKQTTRENIGDTSPMDGSISPQGTSSLRNSVLGGFTEEQLAFLKIMDEKQ